MKIAGTVKLTLVAIALLVPGSTLGANGLTHCTNTSPPLQRSLNDARLSGKVEMALLLNRYLNSFNISTSVMKGRVTLTGNVESRIDRKLAEQIASGIDGVRSVDNRLSVTTADIPQRAGKNVNPGYQRIRDVTLTAQVKSRLVLDRHVNAMNIDVDTSNSIVTLKGHVRSARERSLALRIVNNIENVKSVRDELKVVPAS